MNLKQKKRMIRTTFKVITASGLIKKQDFFVLGRSVTLTKKLQTITSVN